MKIAGCDLHTRYQQVAMLDSETGELIEAGGPHQRGQPGLSLTSTQAGWGCATSRAFRQVAYPTAGSL
jgi:hypothetical protein